MGVCLIYTSLHSVPREGEDAIRAELREDRNDQPWLLCEPPGFYDTEKGGRLRGGSKLNLLPRPDEVEAAAASRPEQNDIRELVRLLCDWSERYGITWQLDLDGDRLGRIEDRVCRGDLLGRLEAIADLSTLLGEESLQRPPDRAETDDPDRPPPGHGLRIWPGPECRKLVVPGRSHAPLAVTVSALVGLFPPRQRHAAGGRPVLRQEVRPLPFRQQTRVAQQR